MLNWKHRYNKTVCSVSLVNKTNVKIKHQFAIILFFPCLHTVISSCTCAYNTYSYLEISADTLLANVLKCVTQQQVKRSSLVTRTRWSGSSDWRSICCKVNALLLCCGNLLVDPRSWPHLWPWAVSWDLMNDIANRSRWKKSLPRCIKTFPQREGLFYLGTQCYSLRSDGWIFMTTACASTPINTSDLTPLSLRLAPETKDAFCNRL